jgi:hypothetical protein
MSLEAFAGELFRHSELLRPLQPKFMELMRSFHDYKYSVPVYG